MKFSSLVLMLTCGLLMTQQGEPLPQNNGSAVCNCNCGANSKLLLIYMKSILKEFKKCTGQGTSPPKCPNKVPKNCAEVLKCGGTKSGIYTVNPDGKGAFKVFCDQTTSRGGWTVFQTRNDGSVDFYQGWQEYKNGFGNLKREFWLGLDKIYRLTHQTRNRLRVVLEDTQGKSAYAEYDYFAVASKRSKYSLSIGTYSGTAGDSLSDHRGAPFTTRDQDNDTYDQNCAVLYKGAWWYTSCHSSNLNGLYHHGKHTSYADGVIWRAWKGYYYSAKRAEMMIKPA